MATLISATKGKRHTQSPNCVHVRGRAREAGRTMSRGAHPEGAPFTPRSEPRTGEYSGEKEQHMQRPTSEEHRFSEELNRQHQGGKSRGRGTARHGDGQSNTLYQIKDVGGTVY